MSYDVPAIKISYDQRALSMMDTLGMEEWNIDMLKTDLIAEVEDRINRLGELKIMKEKLKNNPRIKKWKRSIERFNHLISLDLHTEDIKNEKPEGDINVNKNDTEHILIVTKALLKYAEELLEENEN